MVGIEKEEEMAEIAAILQATADLSEAERADIESRRAELGKRFCRGCDYCQPCPQEIPISSVLRMKSFAKRFPAERFYGGVGQNMVDKGETCTECGECEERCPYELPVREMIQENVAWFHEQMALR